MAIFRPRPTKLAKRLRNDATPAERHLWRHLRRRQVGGWKFSRQMPVGPFVCDFLCREAALVVEVDGGQHAESEIRDETRTQYLENEGYRVIRFWNNEVLENIDGVLQVIAEVLQDPPPAPPASGRGVPSRGEILP